VSANGKGAGGKEKVGGLIPIRPPDIDPPLQWPADAQRGKKKTTSRSNSSFEEKKIFENVAPNLFEGERTAEPEEKNRRGGGSDIPRHAPHCTASWFLR